MTSDQQAIELKGILKKYDDTEQGAVLRDLDLRVEKADTVAIVGPSGSGKTTLLNIVGGLDSPSLGTVTVLGSNLAGLSDDRLADLRNMRIGFIFQMHHLLPQCTALENVLLPAIARTRTRTQKQTVNHARELLAQVGLADRCESFPDNLSGGERQRVAVARALINSPDLILADEPTGSLDNQTAASVAELLTTLNAEHGATLVLATHSDTIARLMSKQYLLVNGKLQ